jgi:hypothetical protein
VEVKRCNLCTLGDPQIEGYFLLECEAFDFERVDFWNQRNLALGAMGFVDSLRF